MPTARDARDWAAAGGLHGIGDSLYTPFAGTDGEDIDWDAYRTLVRYCVGDLGHAMLWLTSGVGEWWSLTIDERKRLLEIAVDEARALAPETVIQACTSAASAAETSGWLVQYPQRPDYFTHWGEAFKRGAETIGLPIGDYAHSRPPQALLPEHAIAQIRAAYERVGMAGKAFSARVPTA